MTFDEVKTEILQRARRLAMCNIFQDVVKATTYDELIEAGRPNLTWAWKTKIIDETLLDEFDPDLLMTYGIYYKKTGTMITPGKPYPFQGGDEIWIIMGTSVIYNIASTNIHDSYQYRVNLLDTDATITLGDYVYLDAIVYNSTGQLNTGDFSTTCVEIQNIQEQAFDIHASDDVGVEVVLRSRTVLNIYQSDKAFLKVEGYAQSVVNANIDEDETKILYYPYSQSSINYLAL